MTVKAKSKRSPRRAKASKGTTDQVLAKMLAIIKEHPGIRPSDLNRRMNRAQSDSVRATLIRRGLVRKVMDGRATHLYAR
jgi:hypothetical protein